MKQLLFFSVLIILFFSCQEAVDLRGHWHVYPQGETSLETEDYHIMDIIDDTSGIFSYSGAGKFYGWIDKKAKTMFFGAECFALSFDYKIEEGNRLKLKETMWDKYFIASKCDSLCCDKFKDFFAYQTININLPIEKNTYNLENYDNYPASRYFHLYFGKPKKKYLKVYEDKYYLGLNNIISFPRDLPLWYEKNLIKIAKRHHSKIQIIVFADRLTPMNSILPSFNVLDSLQIQKVQFALRNDSIQQNFKVWLKPLELEKLEEIDKSVTVGEWIGKTW